MDLQEVEWEGMDWIAVSEKGQVAEACECGNEPSGSMKWAVFLD